MKNGIYQKGIDMRIKTYYLDDDFMVMITISQHPDEPMILTGDKADKLMEALMKRMEPDEES